MTKLLVKEGKAYDISWFKLIKYVIGKSYAANFLWEERVNKQEYLDYIWLNEYEFNYVKANSPFMYKTFDDTYICNIFLIRDILSSVKGDFAYFYTNRVTNLIGCSDYIALSPDDAKNIREMLVKFREYDNYTIYGDIDKI